MCGIFGATTSGAFITLYFLNKERGDFSYGGLYYSFDLVTLIKKKEDASFNVPYGYNIYLGHTRAPTNVITYFNFSEAHPFIYENWVVGHNGIILNFNNLKEKYDIPNNVDSSCIPYLLSKGNQYIEVDTIKWTLEQLDGIYACWIFNLDTGNLYLVRCGSPLYYDIFLKQFSSVKTENAILLKEGMIYKSNSYLDELQVVGEFKFNSPYLTP